MAEFDAEVLQLEFAAGLDRIGLIGNLAERPAGAVDADIGLAEIDPDNVPLLGFNIGMPLSDVKAALNRTSFKIEGDRDLNAAYSFSVNGVDVIARSGNFTGREYMSWYYEPSGSKAKEFQDCREMPRIASAINANLNNAFDYTKNIIEFQKAGCGAVIQAQMTVGRTKDKKDEVDGFTITMYDNVIKRDALGQDYDVLKSQADKGGFAKPKIENPKF